MFIYLVMAFWAAMGLVFNTRISGMMVQSLAPTGAMFTFLHLDRRFLGQADVGNMVGVGCTPDIGADPVFPLYRVHCAAFFY